MPRDHRLYLDDILEAIDKILLYIARMDFSQFVADPKTVDAVVHNLAVIGEASRNRPDNVKEAAPPVEWKKIVALRNILVHEYFGVSKEVVWDIVKNKLPTLKTACKDLLGPE